MANILVPFDFSDNAVTALDQAIYLAKDKAYTIEVLHILNLKAAHEYPNEWQIDPHHVDFGAIESKLQGIVADRKLACGGTEAVAIKSTVRESVMINGGIINHMLEQKSDLIVMGTHGASNAAERFYGSNTSTMINHSLFPILAVPRNWKAVNPSTLLAAIALKEAAVCLPLLEQWALWMSSSAEVVSISSIPDTDQEELNKLVNQFPHIHSQLVPKTDDLPMWKTLVNYTADKTNAFLVMFVHERTVFQKLFNYSITSKVSEGIQIPLLAVPTAKKS